jgi:hypothetical protein
VEVVAELSLEERLEAARVHAQQTGNSLDLTDDAPPVVPPEVQQPVVPPEVQQPVVPPEVQQPVVPPEVQQPVVPPEVQQPVVPPEVQQPVKSSRILNQEARRAREKDRLAREKARKDAKTAAEAASTAKGPWTPQEVADMEAMFGTAAQQSTVPVVVQPPPPPGGGEGGAEIKQEAIDNTKHQTAKYGAHDPKVKTMVKEIETALSRGRQQPPPQQAGPSQQQAGPSQQQPPRKRVGGKGAEDLRDHSKLTRGNDPEEEEEAQADADMEMFREVAAMSDQQIDAEYEELMEQVETETMALEQLREQPSLTPQLRRNMEAMEKKHVKDAKKLETLLRVQRAARKQKKKKGETKKKGGASSFSGTEMKE